MKYYEIIINGYGGELVNGKVTKEVEYLSAIEEAQYTIAQAKSLISEEGHFLEELVLSLIHIS